MSTTSPPDVAPAPAGYDPSRYPVFAVTVDTVIVTLHDRELKVLLVRRGKPPFERMWAIPGGFKLPTETLDEAARRELAEETGVDASSLLTQLGAYGDPGRDPRMNVVTVAYVAVLRDVDEVVAGTDASDARLFRVSDVMNGRMHLAFDHLRIVGDALERVRAELGRFHVATMFLGETFTLGELRGVYDAVWGVRLDPANFRRSVTADDWVVPTGELAPSGHAGGKPAELYRPGDASADGSPVRRPRSSS